MFLIPLPVGRPSPLVENVTKNIQDKRRSEFPCFIRHFFKILPLSKYKTHRQNQNRKKTHKINVRKNYLKLIMKTFQALREKFRTGKAPECHVMPTHPQKTSWSEANKFGKQFRFYNQYLIRMRSNPIGTTTTIPEQCSDEAKRCCVVIALAGKDLYDVSSRVVPVFIIWEGN